MKKFELIRRLFEVVMKNGVEDNKQDSISEGCTRDGFENPVYVRKLDLRRQKITDDIEVDSISITGQNHDLSDACDSDVRIAFFGNTGQRVIVYANELDTKKLHDIYLLLDDPSHVVEAWLKTGCNGEIPVDSIRELLWNYQKM